MIRLFWIFASYVMYSYSSWVIFNWHIITGFNFTGGETRNMNILILLHMGVIQIRWSKFADKYKIFIMLPLCAVLGGLHVFSSIETYNEFVIKQVLHGCAVALIVPICSKFCALHFIDSHLNLVFCILNLSTTTGRSITKLVDLLIYGQLGSWTVTFVEIIIAITAIVSLTLFFLRREEKTWEKPICKINMKLMLKTPFLRNLTLSAMLLGFAEAITFNGFAITYIFLNTNDENGITESMSDIIVGLSGFLGGLILSLLCRDNQVVKYFFKMHLCCYLLLGVCIVLNRYELIHCGVALFVVGFYLNTPTMFISGSVAARFGENHYHAGAAVTGLVHGFGDVGKAVAMIALYLIPFNMETTLIVVSSIMSTCSLYLLSKTTDDKELLL